jgi:2-polyprenyl-3-methyl-5-hydroxy-6-metoxy-1,4-benzoquinol methylase
MNSSMNSAMNTVDRPLRDHYWEYMRRRDEFLADPTPALPWWMSAGDEPLNPTEAKIFEFVASATSVVDIGAGDGRIREKFRRAGYSGTYVTVDSSPEFAPDYASIDALPTAAFDAALLLEVIEHVPLADFDAFMDHVLRTLSPHGRLVVSTPNAAYVGSIWEGDMTHVHAYRLQDLAAYLSLRGFDCRLFRVAWRPPRPTIHQRLRLACAKVVTRWMLELDYARGALVLARRRD